MASRRSEIQEDVTLRALRLIGENPTLSQRDLASRVGISVGAAHYCLSALAEKGLIKLGNFQASRNKGGYAYILTPKGIRTALAEVSTARARRRSLGGAWRQRRNPQTRASLCSTQPASSDHWAAPTQKCRR